MWKLKFSLIIVVLSALCLSACTQARAPVTHYGIKSGAGSAGIHTVQSNDTLYSIAKRYRMPMRDIVIANNLSAPFYLRTGQRLKLPPPREYDIRPGDSLYTVSRLFGVSTSELAQINDLQHPYVIHAGDTLRIPVEIKEETSITVQSDRIKVTPAPKPVTSESLDPAQASSNIPTPGDKPAAPSKTTKSAKSKIPSHTPKRSSSKFLTPVRGHVISSYGPKKGGLHNDGLNFAAPRGAPVKAAENGVVVYVGNDLKGTGNLVLIRHADRWMSAYAHLDKTKIARGQTVGRGDLIGTVGTTGSVTTPQLHFELRRGTKALNPKVYLEK